MRKLIAVLIASLFTIVILCTPLLINTYMWNDGVCRKCHQPFQWERIESNITYFTCGCKNNYGFSNRFLKSIGESIIIVECPYCHKIIES